ncbi:MAG: PDDEXK nuclease domain-containing protein [Coriobacteriales bacterium]|nr:PDDEXK nuclease domain-containing protein [Coriobacteriales bacterium]
MGKGSITIHSDLDSHEIRATVPGEAPSSGVNTNLYDEIREILVDARQRAYRAINSEMVRAYWSIGRAIVEDEQDGEARGVYGKGTLKSVSSRLQAEFGTGFSVRNLQLMKRLYLTYPNANALRTHLTWTHYRTLLRIQNKDKREWYAREAERAHWSSRQMERQINTFYYERLAQSVNKEPVIEEAQEKIAQVKPEEFIKDPYVLEFAGLDDNPELHESMLEQALIDHLQEFLLELGRGFAFVARQQHVDLDSDHFYIDLVFYNYVLKCFVLIDLKTTKLTHQDIGQMDTYVRIYDDLFRASDDNPTIGIVLCSEKSETLARYSVLKDSKQLFASIYMLTLPTEEELQEFIQQERNRLEAGRGVDSEG